MNKNIEEEIDREKYEVMVKEVIKYLLDEYLKWQRDMGGPRPMTEFAIHLGVGDKVLSTYFSGRSLPSYRTARKICKKLHSFKLLQIMGYEVPFTELPTDTQDRFLSVLVEIQTTCKKRNIDINSSEGKEVVKELFEKSGFNVNAIEIS